MNKADRRRIERAARKAGWSRLGISLESKVPNGGTGYWADWCVTDYVSGRLHFRRWPACWTDRIRCWGKTPKQASDRCWRFAARLLSLRLSGKKK